MRSLDEMHECGRKKLLSLAQVPPLAYASTKKLLRQDIIESIKKNIHADRQHFVATIQSDAVQERVKSKLKQLGKKSS